MTNSNLKRINLITPESASVFLPVIISSLISIVIISAFVIPKYIKSNKVFYELKEFIRKRDELPKLKGQYIVINKKLKRLEEKKSQIIELISGKTNLETFLSRLGNIGIKNNIQFTSIVPDSFVKFIPPVSNELDNADITLGDLDIKVDPLLVEGVKKYTMDFSILLLWKSLLCVCRASEGSLLIVLLPLPPRPRPRPRAGISSGSLIAAKSIV